MRLFSECFHQLSWTTLAWRGNNKDISLKPVAGTNRFIDAAQTIPLSLVSIRSDSLPLLFNREQ